MKKLLFGLIAGLASGTAAHAAPISLTAGSTYFQNFNSLPTNTAGSTTTQGISATTLPTGLVFAKTGTTSTTYGAGNGSGTNPDAYSFGATDSTERAFGTLRTNAVGITIGFNFVNNTGGTLNELAVSYDGELYRNGNTSTTAPRQDFLDFAYSTDATSLAGTGTYTEFNAGDVIGPSLLGPAGVVSPATSLGTISFTLTGLNIADGSEFYFRFVDRDVISADDGLAIDNLSVTTPAPVPEPGTWGMMAIGVAALGLLTRKRKQNESGSTTALAI